MTNAEAVEQTIAAIGERLTSEHAALVAMAHSLAAAVDADPCSNCGAGQNAALWKEYRATITTLTEVGADDLDDDALTFRGSIQIPSRASLGNTSQS